MCPAAGECAAAASTLSAFLTSDTKHCGNSSAKSGSTLIARSRSRLLLYAIVMAVT